MDNNLIIKRLKEYYHCKSDKELGEILGISRNTLASWGKKCGVNYELIIEKCPDVDLNWLFRGENIQQNTMNISTPINDDTRQELKQCRDQLSKALDIIATLSKQIEGK